MHYARANLNSRIVQFLHVVIDLIKCVTFEVQPVKGVVAHFPTSKIQNIRGVTDTGNRLNMRYIPINDVCESTLLTLSENEMVAYYLLSSAKKLSELLIN